MRLAGATQTSLGMEHPREALWLLQIVILSHKKYSKRGGVSPQQQVPAFNGRRAPGMCRERELPRHPSPLVQGFPLPQSSFLVLLL